MKGKRGGFSVLSPEQRKAVASKGGKSVPSNKRSFSQDRTLAAEAGRKGGQARHNDENVTTRALKIARAYKAGLHKKPT